MDQLAERSENKEGAGGLKTIHIHIKGRVQGVGFRPFVFRKAIRDHRRGYVLNTVDGVHIQINIPNISDAESFIDFLRTNHPEQAEIEEINWEIVPYTDYSEFRIIQRKDTGRADLLFTPDFAVCPDCKNEIRDPADRRYRYAFTTCTHCGPRYSIIKTLPYDRENTSMKPYIICRKCSDEYNDPLNRRFYSQTNSCSDCAVKMTLYDASLQIIESNQQKLIDKVVTLLQEGKILAIKGIGGYLLMADATSPETIKELRKRKHRPTKPFALMYPDLEMIGGDVEFSVKDRVMWKSSECPIILCLLNKNFKSRIQPQLIAPGLRKIGIMLPYTPLFVLIMDEINRPVIATSGNISGSPVIYNEKDAFEHLSHIADYILVNDREIVVPQDDSVIQFTEGTGEKIILRRSRGYAPAFTGYKERILPPKPVLGMGALLKSAFGMFHGNRFYLSQFLGNTDSLESQESYDHVLEHLMKVLDFSPEVIVTDLHPDYYTSRKGIELAELFHADLVQIQHHEAHAWSVLAENQLLENEKVLSIVWDGTGLGDDGQIWGGEFFTYRHGSLYRAGHPEYFPHLLGDKMTFEPRLAAFSLARMSGPAACEFIRGKFSKFEWNNFLRIYDKAGLKTSSMGRLFDGVSSMLGLSDLNTYEGESAMYLEAAAAKFLNSPDTIGFNEFYPVTVDQDIIIHTSELIEKIIEDLKRGTDTGEIAARFHLTLVMWVKKAAEILGYREIAFSGGVFQNSLLVDLLRQHLEGPFKLHFQRELSPNDENIPFGQIIGWMMKQEKVKKREKEIENIIES